MRMLVLMSDRDPLDDGPPTVEVIRSGGPENNVRVKLPAGLSGPDIDLSHMEAKQPIILQPGFGHAILKVYGAKHFLDLFERHSNHQVLATYYFDAFLSLARAVTWVLKKECHGLPGFEAWYAAWEKKLAKDPRARMFRNLRNEAEKEGAHRPHLSFHYEMVHELDSTIRVGNLRTNLTIRKGQDTEALPEAQAYLNLLVELVEDGRKNGFPLQTIPDGEIDWGLDFLRRTPNGDLVRFEPPNWEPRPEEFESRKAYDQWKRSLPRRHASARQRSGGHRDSG
jgi:hypothetical protein